MGQCLARATREFGLDGVELSWHESFCRPHCTLADLDTLAALRSQHDARLSAHIWSNLAEVPPAAAQEDLLRWLHRCEQTDVRDLIVHGGSYPDRKEGIRRTRHVLERVLPEFERRRITLNVENHYAFEYRDCHELFSQPWEFAEILDLGSPSLKCCFDTGHGNMTGNTGELLDALAPWVNYVHLADNHDNADDHVAYGRGTVAWQEVFERLKQNAFDGVFCIEFPVREDRSPLDACVERIRKQWPAVILPRQRELPDQTGSCSP
jgi:sugar phosphate isomerase/epimerase